MRLIRYSDRYLNSKKFNYYYIFILIDIILNLLIIVENSKMIIVQKNLNITFYIA